MIEIKLVFPNYEAAISALAAVRANGAEVKAETPKPEVKDAATPTKAEKPVKVKVVATEPTAAAVQTAASPTPPAESQSPTTSSGATATKEQVTAAITETVKTDRQKVVDTLTSFGAKSGKDLKPEQYHDFLVKLNTVEDLA